MKTHTILFIEDDKSGRELGIYNMEKAGYNVIGVESGEKGLQKFAKSPTKFSVVITDLKMDGISGMEVLKQIHKESPTLPIIVITAFGNVEIAVEAIKNGAYDFITKPFNRNHLILIIKRAIEKKELNEKVKKLELKTSGIEREIIYKSKSMEELITASDRFAKSNASVLITGESGTGKELFARRIHVKSKRAFKPFIPINCAAIPGELLESELFGHVKGSFTGASSNRIGKFRQGNGGTIFLDEIGELPLKLQAKMLRVIQEKEVYAVGSEKPTQIDVRFISATNKDLFKLMETGEFREDLFYRLNVVELSLTPLRERKQDIKPLVESFIKSLSEGRELFMGETLLNELQNYNWPGNIRELHNICERLVLLCTGNELSIKDLPKRRKKPGIISENIKSTGEMDFLKFSEDGFSLLDMEKEIIEKVLELNKGNITKTADYLQIPRHVLSYRMEKYGISKKTWK
jgi:two-component system, NtrC family, response regulator